jgi:mannose-6-phosphate isomerase-like protein (cupin superfamily)
MRFKRRSWGWYFTLFDRKHFKVKILKFMAGQSCSLQYHKHRHELWLFLKGEGAFRRNTERERIGAGDYKSVGKYVEHKYYAAKNTTVLEIQYGPICDESDIVRL